MILAATRTPARRGVNRWQWHDPRYVRAYDGARMTGDDGYPTGGIVDAGHVVARDTRRGTLLFRGDSGYWEATRLGPDEVAITRRCPFA